MGCHIRVVGNEQLRREVSEAEQLSPEGPLGLDPDGQIGKRQYALVAFGEGLSVARGQPFGRAMHLVTNHENLLVERESPPAVLGQVTVLRNSFSPFPISSKVSSRTAARISRSVTPYCGSPERAGY